MSNKIHIPLYKKVLIISVILIAINMIFPVIIIMTIIANIVSLFYDEK